MAIGSLHNEIGKMVAAIPKPPKPKCGKYIQDAVAAGLNEPPHFSTRKEDSDHFLQAQMPVWRTKRDNREIERTVKRRKIDIVVYEKENPAALIEIESDLNDLRRSGITNRASGKNYDVFSIAKAASGEHFHSYHSLERMAAAAFYYDLRRRYQSLAEDDFAKFSLESLSAINSDAMEDHNPAGLPMFLIVGSYRNLDYDILKPRLDSLGAKLLKLG
jgi:hypothetical protein